MSSLGERKKTDNAFFEMKCQLRREAIAGLDRVNVLDCFAGENRLWRTIGYDRYLGIEKVKGKGTMNLYGDNVRIIPALDLSQYTVIDVDSYGIPAEQLMALAENTTLPDRVVVIYTAIGGAIARGQSRFISASGVTESAYLKCQMLWNKHMLELFYNLLAKRFGVQKVRRVVMKHNSYEKHYGWFVLTKSAGNGRILEVSGNGATPNE